MKRYLVFLALIAMVSFSCKQRVVTEPDIQQPLQPTPQQTSRQPEEQKAETVPTPIAPEKVTEQKLAENIESAETPGKTSKALEEKEGMFRDVLFDFDKYDIMDAFKPGLKSLSAYMIKNTDIKLSVEGHCDDRGTNEYNLALGDRRAKAVRDYLVSLGVPSSRIETLSYGEEKPLCTEQTEECWARNRRAHFVVLSKAGK
jgi:peptidoglycan-associated lipoprotein